MVFPRNNKISDLIKVEVLEDKEDLTKDQEDLIKVEEKSNLTYLYKTNRIRCRKISLVSVKHVFLKYL